MSEPFCFMRSKYVFTHQFAAVDRVSLILTAFLLVLGGVIITSEHVHRSMKTPRHPDPFG
jgi:hypothetical protein